MRITAQTFGRPLSAFVGVAQDFLVSHWLLVVFLVVLGFVVFRLTRPTMG